MKEKEFFFAIFVSLTLCNTMGPSYTQYLLGVGPRKLYYEWGVCTIRKVLVRVIIMDPSTQFFQKERIHVHRWDNPVDPSKQWTGLTPLVSIL